MRVTQPPSFRLDSGFAISATVLQIRTFLNGRRAGVALQSGWDLGIKDDQLLNGGCRMMGNVEPSVMYIPDRDGTYYKTLNVINKEALIGVNSFF
jgi:hypothetical protein